MPPAFPASVQTGRELGDLPLDALLVQALQGHLGPEGVERYFKNGQPLLGLAGSLIGHALLVQSLQTALPNHGSKGNPIDPADGALWQIRDFIGLGNEAHGIGRAAETALLPLWRKQPAQFFSSKFTCSSQGLGKCHLAFARFHREPSNNWSSSS